MSEILSHKGLKSYFEGFVAHPQINGALYGGLDEFFDKIKAKADPIAYPFFYVPVRFSNADFNNADLNFNRMVFLLNLYKPWKKTAAQADWHDIVEELEPIMDAVIGKVFNDIDEQTAPWRRDTDYKGRGPNISEPTTSDRLVGISFELTIIQQSAVYYDPEIWTPPPPPAPEDPDPTPDPD